MRQQQGRVEQWRDWRKELAAGGASHRQQQQQEEELGGMGGSEQHV